MVEPIGQSGVDAVRAQALGVDVSLPTPYYEKDGIVIYHGDCREILPHVEADAVVTDPPYPNNAGHFDDAVEAARDVLRDMKCPGLVFWTEIERPPCPLPLVAVHIWHRTNSNRPDNYEPVFFFHPDGKKRASRVLPYAVISVGLTGCKEATGHPTQKNERLMTRLARMTEGIILDPFMGSGTTLRAAKDLGRKAIGPQFDRARHRRLHVCVAGQRNPALLGGELSERSNDFAGKIGQFIFTNNLHPFIITAVCDALTGCFHFLHWLDDAAGDKGADDDGREKSEGGGNK